MRGQAANVVFAAAPQAAKDLQTWKLAKTGHRNDAIGPHYDQAIWMMGKRQKTTKGIGS